MLKVLFLSRISLVRDFFFAFIFVNIIICNYLYINLHIENKKQTRMEKNIYTVMYFGNAKRYQDLRQEIAAISKREAVERFYSSMLNSNYFPEDEFSWCGLVRDCAGNVIADANDETIEYDGGHFYAELKIVE